MLDQNTNLLLAKKYMVESIYRSANIEGIGVTFPETQTICDGMAVSGHSVDDINAVTDLKHAWQWIFNNIDCDVNVDTLKQLNRVAGKFTVINAGSIRDIYDEPIRVPISKEKDYYPPLPPPVAEIDAKIKTIISSGTLDAALELFCYVCKCQFFNDGNKRTATLFANMFMIKNGLGVLSIPLKHRQIFYECLTAFYDDDINKTAFKSFLQENCLTGNTREHNIQEPNSNSLRIDYSKEITNVTELAANSPTDVTDDVDVDPANPGDDIDKP